MKKMYHIFSDNFDDWLDDYKQAKEWFEEAKKNKLNARVYEELWENAKIDDECIEENCILSYGSFPY